MLENCTPASRYLLHTEQDRIRIWGSGARRELVVEEKMEEKSKSQIKREMYALQDLGEQLVRLSRGQLEQVELPQELREAVLFARSLKKHEAHRRQLQYIGAGRVLILLAYNFKETGD